MVRTLVRRSYFGMFVVVTAIALLCMQSGSSRATHEGTNPHISDRLPNTEVVPGQIIVKYGERTTPGEEAIVRRGIIQQRFDVAPHRFVIGASDEEVCRAVGRRSCARLLKELLDSPPALRRHASDRHASRASAMPWRGASHPSPSPVIPSRQRLFRRRSIRRRIAFR